MSVQVCKRFLVSGRVQGVFYRASAARHAAELGVTGWAENLADGRVEVYAWGAADAVERLGEWLEIGPGGARVKEVVSVLLAPAQAPPRPDQFSTR